MAEMLHRLRTKDMQIEVYEDLVRFNSSFSVLELPPRSIVSIRLIPMNFLREGRIEVSASMTEQSEPITLKTALPPTPEKERVAKKLVATVSRLRDEGAGRDRIPAIHCRMVAPEEGFANRDELAEDAAVSASLSAWRGHPAIRVACGDTTLGYVPRDPNDRFVETNFQFLEAFGTLPGKVKDGLVCMGYGFSEEDVERIKNKTEELRQAKAKPKAGRR